MKTNIDFRFMEANIVDGPKPVSQPLLSRVLGASADPSLLQRASGSDADAINALAELQRAITTSTSGFPVREDLESEATLLVPKDTPLRNMIPRKAGAGVAHQWRQVTGYGGGWGTSVDQPGGGSAAQFFYGESAAPATFTSSYVNKTATYKCLGMMGSVSGLAMAAGANFQNQLATEKMFRLSNLMLAEEYTIIYGDHTATAAPFGDGTTAFGYDGLLNLVTTGNGTPSGQIQTTVGALTLAHLDAQLSAVWNQGGRDLYMIVNAQEAQSLAHLAAGSELRVVVEDQSNAALGLRIGRYLHTVSGEYVKVIVSRFLAAGTIIFGAERCVDNAPALEMVVLPQVQSPLLPGQLIQGYVAHDIAPSATSPDVYNFLISVYEVLAMKDAKVFAKSTGVTAV